MHKSVIKTIIQLFLLAITYIILETVFVYLYSIVYMIWLSLLVCAIICVINGSYLTYLVKRYKNIHAAILLNVIPIALSIVAMKYLLKYLGWA